MKRILLSILIIFPLIINAQNNVCFGAIFPERRGDLSWENDRVGFRAYGPESQQKKDNLYGYDLFMKRVSYPVLDKWYANQCNKNYWNRINALKKAGRREEAKLLEDSITYHKDHGEGADFYAVGPTLGAGTNALRINGEIIYPYCYKTAEILRNNSDVFEVHMTFNPFVVGNDTVTEHRIISLRKGSQLNKATVWYEGLRQNAEIVVGIVIHKGQENVVIDKKKRFMTYDDPTQTKDGSDGIIRIGAVFPDTPNSIGKEMFEKAKGDATGQLLAISQLHAGSKYTYYFGYGWTKFGFKKADKWIKYLSRYVDR